MGDTGVLYFAKGEKFISEAKVSAERVKDLMEVPITLVTNSKINYDYFDEVILDKTAFEKSDKPRSLLQSPYEKTIFLDSDIWLENSIFGLFEILDQFELALAKDPKEEHVHHMDKSHPIAGVPEAFPEYNTGVLAFRKTPNMIQLLEDWEQRCEADADRDQLSFRSALYYSDVKFASLRPEYNCMYRAPNALNSSVKVFHGQLARTSYNPIPLEVAIKKLNRNPTPRVSYRYNSTLVITPPVSRVVRQRNKISRLRSILDEEGIGNAIKRTVRYLYKRLIEKD